MVKFFIDDTEIVESPEGWDGLTTTLRFDRELKGLFTTMDVSLTFHADGYTLLKAAYDASGYCHSMPFEIRQQNTSGHYLPVFTGIIYLKDIEWAEGLSGAYAKCQIKDNSFFAKIFNNKNIKARPYVPTSKLGETIVAAGYKRINFFTPSTGAYIAHITGAGNERTDTGFLVYDVLRFFIDFISDGTVDFISDSFASGGAYEGAMITNGYVCRFVGTGVSQPLFEDNWPELSLSEVITEINKQYNIGFYAGYDGGRPFFKVEAYNDLFPLTALATLSGVDNLKRKTASEYLYSNVVVGSTDTMNDPALSFPGDIRFIGFKEEDYLVAQSCNIDRELNISNSWIIDTNVIEELIINGQTTATTAYDRTIVLIHGELDTANDWLAVQSNWISASAVTKFYNEIYTSQNKTLRFLGGVPAPIATYLGITDNGFEARVTTTASAISLVEPVAFDNPILDPNGNYDATALHYSVPVSGSYTFHVHFDFHVFNSLAAMGLVGMFTKWMVRFKVYDAGGFAGGILLQDVHVGTYTYSHPSRTGDNVSVDFTGTLNLTATDTVIVSLNVFDDVNTGTEMKAGSYWETGSIVDGGGHYQTYDQDNYPIMRSTFNYPFSFDNFLTLKAQPLGLIQFSVDRGGSYYGWIEEVKYNHFQGDGNATFTLISNENINR
jgi:hypothetical protein